MTTRLYETFVLPEQTAAATPAANSVVFYAKTDGRLYGKDDVGTEFRAGMPDQIAGNVDVLAGLVTQGFRAASSNPPLNLGTGAITAGVSTFSWTSTAAVGLTVNGPASHAANLQEWKVNGTTVASINQLGWVTSPLLLLDANSHIATDAYSGNPSFILDSGVSWQYHRTNKSLTFYMPGADGNGVQSVKTLTSSLATTSSIAHSASIDVTSGAHGDIIGLIGNVYMSAPASGTASSEVRGTMGVVSFLVAGTAPTASTNFIGVRASSVSTAVSSFPGATFAGFKFYTDSGGGGNTTFDKVYGLHLSTSTALIGTNGKWGIYQDSTDKNYLAGALGLNVLSPAAGVKLDVAGGVRLGSASSDVFSVHGATPVVQPAGNSDILAALVTQGLRAASSNPPLNLGSGAITAGAITMSGAFISSGGNFRVDSSGRLGMLGNAAVTDRIVDISAAHPSTNTALVGISSIPIAPSTDTSSMVAIRSGLRTATASFTLALGNGVRVESPTLGAGSAITDLRGIQIVNQGASGVDTAYGLYINAIANAATNNISAALNGGTQANLWLASNTATEAGGIAFGTTIDTSLSRNAAGILQIGGAAAANAAIIVTDQAINSGQTVVHRNTATGGYEWANSVHGPNRFYVMKDPGAATLTAVGTAAPTINGTASDQDSTDGPWLRTATTAVSGNAAGIISAFTVVRTDWLPEFSIRVKPSTTASIRLWFGLFSGSPDASDVPAIHMAAFRFDSGVDGTAFWRTVTDNGSGTPTITTTTRGIAGGSVYTLRIATRQSDGAILFYVNGVLVSTHTTTLPTTTQLLGYGARVTTLAAASKNIQVARIALSYL